MKDTTHTLINRGQGGVVQRYYTVLRQKVASACKHGAATVASLSFGLIWFVAPAAAQSTSDSCGDVPLQFQQIAELLTRIQQLGVALGLLFAVFMYIICGIYYMRGTPEAQERARRIFINTTIGLVIILMAGGFVEFVNGILCPGGG